MSGRSGSSNDKQAVKHTNLREPSTRHKESPIKLNDYDLEFSPEAIMQPKRRKTALSEAENLDQKNKKSALTLGQSSQKVI